MDENDLSNISSCDDDDDFSKIFEIDHGFTESEGDDCDKENRNRSAKAKKLQFKKLMTS